MASAVTDYATLQQVETPGAVRRLARHRKVVLAGGFLLLVVVAVALGPLLYRLDPTKIDLTAVLQPAATPGHPLGTDENGRDVLARLLSGGRVSLLVGLAAMSLTVALGIAVGGTTAYLGGWADRVAVQLIDGMLSVPLFFLWLILLTTFRPNLLTIVLVIGTTSWMTTARVVRSDILRVKQLEFVDASRAIGSPHRLIFLRHCLPQALSSIVVSATLATAFAILSESALSFLGIGIQPPTASWGNMLTSAEHYVWTAPMLAIYPGAAILSTVLAINLLGDGLRDVLSPHD
jgi:peptide/nickel transport system permease protein